MRLFLLRTCGLAFLCSFSWLAGAQDWKTAESLPGVDFSGLSAAQKASVLKVIRESGCSCGCGYKMAECRMVDSQCAYSRGLVAVIADAIKSGKSEADALTAAENSRFARVQQPKLLEDPINIPVAGAPVIGVPGAEITLVEFSDFQCPYCAVAVGQIKEILEAYPSHVKLIFKEFPLEMHPQAGLAATAAVAAQKQGKFWEMHDAMFNSRNNLSRENILAMAKDIGLDVARFEGDLNSTEVRETVIRDLQDGDAAGVQGTPSLFINGQHYNGPIKLQVLKPLLDAQLKNASPKQTASVSR